jgi:hypothetical protein
MGANLEVFIISNKIINIEEIKETANNKLGSFQIFSAKIMDNWEYSNYEEFNTNRSLEEVLLQKKIVTINANINNFYEAGAQFYVSNTFFISNLWIDTSYIPDIDTGYINTKNKDVYEKITHIIREKAIKYNIIAVAIGVEMYIRENSFLESMIRDSSNVTRWIIFNSNIQKVDGFELTTIDNPKTSVYSKIQQNL